MTERKVIIGLETHVQLHTESKMFCGCSTFARKKAWVKEFLESKGAAFEFVEHEAVTRPVNSAKARGVQVKQIAKALVYVCNAKPIIFVLSGDRKLDAEKVASFLNCADLRMARPEEVKKFTGCVVGLVPPTIEGIRKIFDKRLLENDLLSFNAGIQTAGIKIKKQELLNVLDNFEIADISSDDLIAEKPSEEKNRSTTAAEEDPPNSRTCEICLGMPGSKPVVNKKAIDFALLAALALNCKINREFFFSRKTYFYPDMAKNFQISQFEIPVGTEGFITLESGKKIRIRRVHLEEDPAALVHEQGMHASNYCLVDYNRSGIPLIEVVSEPDISSPVEARDYMNALLNILNYLNVFVQGQDIMKADANISLEGSERVEIKNISSFRGIEKALEFEAQRQKALLEKGERVVRETRGFVAENDTTKSLRTKESEEDYGFIFEPDLTKIVVDEKWLAELKKRLPELPEQKVKRLSQEYHINNSESRILTSSQNASNAFEYIAKDLQAKGIAPSIGSRFVIRELMGIANYNKLDYDVFFRDKDPKQISEVIILKEQGKLSEKNAKEAMIKYVNEKILPMDFLKKNNLLIDLKQQDLQAMVENVLKENQKAFEELKVGNKKSLNFLVGLVMRQAKGKAEPRLVQKIIEEKAR